jgi:hypothetical protein
MVVSLGSECEGKLRLRMVELGLMCYTADSIYDDLNGLLLLPPCLPFFV